MLDTDLVTFVPSSQGGPIPVHVPLREIHVTTVQSVSVVNGGNFDGSTLADSSKRAPHINGLKLKKRQYSKSPDSHVTEAHPAKVPKHVRSPDSHVTEAHPAKVAKHVRSPDSHVTQAHPAKEPLYGIVTENEWKQTVPIGSSAPEGRQAVAAGSLTPEGRQAVVLERSAPVDNELDVLLRLYQCHPLGEEPQSVESECQPVGGFNRSPPASPPKTNSTGGHGKEEEEEKRGDSLLATSYLDGTLPFKHNEGESMAVNNKEDGVCKAGLQSCSSEARTVGVSLSDEGDGEGATSSTAARTPRKCSTSTKKARKFVFSSGSKGAPSRRTAKKCLMLEYTDNEPPPPPPPPQQEGVDEGDGSKGLRRGKSTTTLCSFLEDSLARVLHN